MMSVLAFPAPAEDVRLARTLAADDPLRLRLEAACDALESLAARIIAKLDDLGPDSDLEDDELESNLGSAPVTWCDKLLPDEAELDDADAEPWLAAPEGAQSYASFICGGRHEFEDEHDGREPCCEDEGAQVDAEPDDQALCSWRSGEVDQRKVDFIGATNRYVDQGGSDGSRT